MKDRLVPYPFQNNINSLDIEDQLVCLNGMQHISLTAHQLITWSAGLVDAAAAAQHHKGKPANFDEWIVRVMGVGIADMYMRPYNFKVWGHPTDQLATEWLGDPTVRPIDLKTCLANILQGKRAPAPKITFRFPKVCNVYDV